MTPEHVLESFQQLFQRDEKPVIESILTGLDPIELADYIRAVFSEAEQEVLTADLFFELICSDLVGTDERVEELNRLFDLAIKRDERREKKRKAEQRSVRIRAIKPATK